MSDSERNQKDVSAVYAMFWRMIHMTVHRYDSNPTAELLTVMSLILLDLIGYRPTVGDLVKMTGLKKSSVSRYVAAQIKTGYLTEVVDPQDHRRRHLCVTPRAREERQWYRKQILEIAHSSSEALAGLGETSDPVADLKKVLLGITESPTKRT